MEGSKVEQQTEEKVKVSVQMPGKDPCKAAEGQALICVILNETGMLDKTKSEYSAMTVGNEEQLMDTSNLVDYIEMEADFDFRGRLVQRLKIFKGTGTYIGA